MESAAYCPIVLLDVTVLLVVLANPARAFTPAGIRGPLLTTARHVLSIFA